MAQITQMVSPDGENEVTQKTRKAQKWRPSALGCCAAVGEHRVIHGCHIEKHVAPFCSIIFLYATI